MHRKIFGHLHEAIALLLDPANRTVLAPRMLVVRRFRCNNIRPTIQGRLVVEKAEIGLIGLGVMGSNLALNIAEKGNKIAVFNRTPDKTDEFYESAGDL